MKKSLLQSFGFLKAKGKSLAVLPMFLFMLFGAYSLQAQNNHYVADKVYIDSSGFVYVNTGNTVSIEGIVTTVRHTDVAKRGMLSFAGTADWESSNDSYVNGYVRSHKAGAFTFPVGQGSYRPARISGAEDSAPTDAAYYNPALYPPDLRAVELTEVTNESWVIQGTEETIITLSWSEDITYLTNDISTLTIVGWDMLQEKWVEVVSSVEPVSSIFGVASTLLTKGSVSSDAAIAPNDYAAYTLATRGCPIMPAPLVTRTQKFCPGSRVSDLLPQETDIVWYSSITTRIALTGNELLTNNTTYFAARLGETVDCESERNDVLVTIYTVHTPKIKGRK